MKTKIKTNNLFSLKPVKLKTVSFIAKPRKPRMKNLIFGYDRPKPARKVKGKLGMSWPQAKARFPKMSPFGDADKDGVNNWLDCRPFDKKRQSKLFKEEIRHRLVIENKGTKKKKATWQKDRQQFFNLKTITDRDIVKVFEKNPELLKEAEKIKGKKGPGTKSSQIIIEDRSTVNSPASYNRIEGKKHGIYILNAKTGKPTFPKGVEQKPSRAAYIIVGDEMGKNYDLNRIMKHEIGHLKQDEEGRVELLEVEGTSLQEEKGRVTHDKIPTEIDAIRFEYKKFERDKVRKEKPEAIRELDLNNEVDEPFETTIDKDELEEPEENEDEEDDEEKNKDKNK